MIELFGHPFSSYTWKVLIAFHENHTPFTFRMIDAENQENLKRLQSLSPQGKFPLLVDGNTILFESTVIIEYLQLRYPGDVVFIPQSPDEALKARMLDRFFDNYVMTPTQAIVSDFMRKPEDRDPITVTQAKATLARSYEWLNTALADRTYSLGEDFTLADCAAAPSLFYADWVLRIDPTLAALSEYRETLLRRNSVKQCVDGARPYRHFFPPGAPDRD